MEHFEELSLEALKKVSGGKTAPINTGSDQNAGVWKDFEAIGVARANDSLENGTPVNILGAPVFHQAKGRNYVQIEYAKNGRAKKGWVAASIVGLPR